MENNNYSAIEYISRFLIQSHPQLISDDAPGVMLYYDELQKIIDNEGFNIKLTPAFFNSVISYLCQLLPLHAPNYEAIAFALDRLYPETDLINVTDNEIIEMIKTLKNFKDDVRELNKDIISAVVNVWILIVSDDFFDDSSWDANI